MPTKSINLKVGSKGYDVKSEFVLDKGSIYIFSDANMNKIITWYSSSNVDKNKINLINKESLEKGQTPMNYEIYNHSA